MSYGKSRDVDVDVAFLGCGNCPLTTYSLTQARQADFFLSGKLGSAVLTGLISSLSDAYEKFTPPSHVFESRNVKSSFTPFPVIPEGITACVHQQHSADLLREQFPAEEFGFAGVTILTNENVQGVDRGEVVILGVEPGVYEEVLAEPGMRDVFLGKNAFSRKILVSMVGGVSIGMLEIAIYGHELSIDERQRSFCQIVRVTPNTAAAVRQSFTLIFEDDNCYYPPEALNRVWSVFSRVGTVKLCPSSQGHIAATLTASSPAFFALALEGAVNGAVELGMSRAEALEMATAAMRGAATLMVSGESADEVAQKIATPGGSTATGLRVLEEGGVKQLMQEAVVKAASKVGGLGKKK